MVYLDYMKYDVGRILCEMERLCGLVFKINLFTWVNGKT
jgi:hypothetical protein